MKRRHFLAGAAGTAGISLAGAVRSGAAAAPAYRVAVIGHTGRGNYGHHLDKAWLSIPGARIIAVADPDEKGRAGAVKRLKAAQGYADYRRMLDEVKPDFVSICPRWLDRHRDMVVAVARSGVRGIYMEKPLCPTLAEADEMVAACEKNKVAVAVAHQTRYSPRLTVVEELIRSGALGTILELRGRGKEDQRGGGEDLWVLGTHVFNLIHTLGGEPRSCFARVTAKGRPIGKADVVSGNEGIGPLAGDAVNAQYRLAGGAMASFASVRGARGNPSRFGLQVFGSKGVLDIHTGYLPSIHFLPDSSWCSGRTGKAWVPVSSAGVGKPEPLEDGGLLAGNVLALKDLIAAAEESRRPLSSLYDARTATEMIVAVFESQRVGGAVSFPLRNRKNPLTMLG